MSNNLVAYAVDYWNRLIFSGKFKIQNRFFATIKIVFIGISLIPLISEIPSLKTNLPLM